MSPIKSSRSLSLSLSASNAHPSALPQHPNQQQCNPPPPPQADLNAPNPTPPHHPAPLPLHSLLHRLDRLPAANLPLSIHPLLPPFAQAAPRARHAASPLCKNGRCRVPTIPLAGASIGPVGRVWLGASGAVCGSESGGCVEEVAYWYV